MEDYIKMPDLKEGYVYKLNARNATFGIWSSKQKGFAISRIKFGNNFLFVEYHYDCESFATAAPIKEVEKSPFTEEQVIDAIVHDLNKENEILEYLNKMEGDRDDGCRS